MQQRTKHLLFRAGFGTSLHTVDSPHTPKNWQKLLGIVTKPIKIVGNGTPEEGEMMTDTPDKRDILALNVAWTQQLTDTASVAREKLTLFWHDHFACRTRRTYLAQLQNNTLRQHALGNFEHLLQAVSKDAAMLQFLNNQQNKKSKPNENFAREVLELFTLGRNQYTESDIKNAARAFTGWTSDQDTGEFIFRKKFHDFDAKTFRGKSGNFSGEEILTMIVHDKQTARFITEKIWRYYVSDEILDKDIIESLSRALYKSHYHIEKLLTTIYTSDWFYEDRFTGNRIKPPVELITGILQHTSGSFENPEATIFIQRALGQVLFMPPNVGGWPAGKQWIDSSSLTFRMTLPSVLLKNSETYFEAKDDGDVNNAANKASGKRLAFRVDWRPLAERFTKSNEQESLQAIEDYLLACGVIQTNRQLVSTYVKDSKDDVTFVKNAFIAYMSLPEYQLS